MISNLHMDLVQVGSVFIDDIKLTHGSCSGLSVFVQVGSVFIDDIKLTQSVYR